MIEARNIQHHLIAQTPSGTSPAHRAARLARVTTVCSPRNSMVSRMPSPNVSRSFVTSSAADMMGKFQECSSKNDLLLRHRGLLALDLLLQLHQPFDQGLGPRRAAGNIDIHRNQAVDPLQDRIAAIHAAARRAGTHRDAPFRLRHLVPDAASPPAPSCRSPCRKRSSRRLARRKPHHLHAEARDVEALRRPWPSTRSRSRPAPSASATASSCASS
jgi:hypothetical protein